MKVAILTMKEMESRNQGIPRYIRELYKNLKNVTKSYDIDIKKVYLPYHNIFGDAISFEFDSIFNNSKVDKFDIVHIPTSFFIFHRKPKNVKYIVTVHDVNPLKVKTENYVYLIKSRLWRLLALSRGIKFNIKNADAIIVDSTQTKIEVIKAGAQKNKIFVVNLGIDKRYLSNSKTTKLDKKGKFVIGYLGSFATNKNVSFILRSSTVLSNTKDIVFELYGPKTYEYKKLIKTHYSKKNVKFKNSAPESKIVEIYDSFKVFVFPSLYEGFGLPILEAQSRGLPVIIYKYGKVPKEVRKYCFEAESPEHMAQIIENLKENGYNEKLQKKATKYARSFTWKKCAKETLEVYKKAVR